MLNLNEEEIKSILQNRIDNREGPLWDLVKKVDYEIKVAGRDFECIAWIEFKNHLNEKTLHIDLTHNGYMILHAKFNDEMDLKAKIQVSEKIVQALKDMKCPFVLFPHQIQGLDLKALYPII